MEERKMCPKCGVDIGPKGTKKGYCQPCSTRTNKEWRKKAGIPVKKYSYIENGKKLCMLCNELIPLEEFSKNERGLGGVVSYCKPCFRVHMRPSREKVRISTAKWREKHRERALALHRIHQFERRAKVKVTSDGTVTDEFLKDIYGTESCFYCGEITELKERTLEHRQPLSKGGLHSASNIVMACWTCNCSKSDKTEEEFNEYKCKDHPRLDIPGKDTIDNLSVEVSTDNPE